MKRRPLTVFLAALLTAWFATGFASGQKNDQADVQLKAAMNKELVDGDLKGAIEIYQKIIAAFSGNLAVAAQALVQMGQCYEKLGQKEARSAYERVLREFADQSEPARLARQRLAALAPAATAGTAPSSGPEMTVRRVWTTHGRLSTVAGAPSPDGRYLPYYNGDMGDIWVHDFTTGLGRRLFLKKGDWTSDDTEASNPVFAPDGRRFAYTWFNLKSYELRVSDLDGSEPRVICANQDRAPVPYAWSPDGATILCLLGDAKDRRIASVTVADGSARVLKELGTDTPSGLSLSPDGRYVAYDRRAGSASSQRDVFTIEVATGREVPVIEHGADDCVLAWTPDGRRLLFRSDRSGSTDAWAIGVSSGTPQGEPTVIKRDLGAVQPLGFTKTGAFYYRIPGMSREVYTATIDFATGKVLNSPRPAPRRSTGWNHNPDWSWDGQYLAFTSLRRPQNDRFLVLQAVKTGEERELKLAGKDATPRFGLRWAPDGRSVLIETGLGGDTCGLAQVDVRTGAVTPLVKMDNCDLTGFGYTADGKSVFYTAFDPKTSLHALMLRELATGRESELGRYYIRFPALSPDGKWIAFLGYSKTAKTYPLTVIPVTGGAGREVCSFPPTGPRGVAWTPDGRQLIVGILSGRKTELWRVPAAGGTPERIDLAVDGMWQFSLHPDGRRIALETWENNEEVWAIENLLPREQPKPAGLGVRRVLTTDSAAEGAIDAGATIISFTDWVTGDLAVRELPSGNKRRLTNKGSFAQSREYAEFSVPSRDGQQVLYSWMRADGIYELRIMGIDGSGPRTIYEGTGLGEVPEPFDWSPDGRHVLAALNPQDRPGTQLAVLPVAGGSTRAVVTVPAGFWPFQRARFSPDGRFIAFDQQARGGAKPPDIFVVASDGGRRTPLVQHPANDLLIDWSPDGRYILFSSDRGGTNDAWLVAVKDGIPAGEPVLIKKDLGRIAPMGIARDGSFYYGVDTGGREVYLAEVDPASGKVLAAPRLVAERNFGTNVSPEWSPDGRRLLHVSRRGPIGPAFNIPTIRSMETGEARELQTGLAFINQVRWSLDGRSLLCVCIDKADKSGICRIDAQTAAVTMLGDGVFPSGALDDHHILFITGVQDKQAGTAQPVLRMRDLRTGDEQEVVRVSHYRYGVSPDGRRLAFQVADPATKDTVVKVMPLPGGEEREIFRSKTLGVSLSWTADGRSVLVGASDPDEEALWLAPVDGGKPVRFTAGMKGVEGPRLHPDGRQLAFYTSTTGKGEIWVMENFLPTGGRGK